MCVCVIFFLLPFLFFPCLVSLFLSLVFYLPIVLYFFLLFRGAGGGGEGGQWVGGGGAAWSRAIVVSVVGRPDLIWMGPRGGGRVLCGKIL